MDRRPKECFGELQTGLRAPFMPAESQEGEMEWNTRVETTVSKPGIVP